MFRLLSQKLHSLQSTPHSSACPVQMVDIEADTHDGNLVSWHHCHSEEVTAADVNVDKQQVQQFKHIADFEVSSVLREL